MQQPGENQYLEVSSITDCTYEEGKQIANIITALQKQEENIITALQKQEEKVKMVERVNIV